MGEARGRRMNRDGEEEGEEEGEGYQLGNVNSSRSGDYGSSRYD